MAAADIMAAAAAVDGTTDGEVTADTDTIVGMDTTDIMMAMVNLTPHLHLVSNLVVEVLAAEVLAVAEVLAAEVLAVEVLAVAEVQEDLQAEVLVAAEVQGALLVVVLVAAVAVLVVAAEDAVDSSMTILSAERIRHPQ